MVIWDVLLAGRIKLEGDNFMNTIVMTGSIRNGSINFITDPTAFLRKTHSCLTYEDCQHIFSRFSKGTVVVCNLLEQNQKHVKDCTFCQNNLKIVFAFEQQLLDAEKERDLASLLDDESIHTSFALPLHNLTIFEGEPVFTNDDVIH